MRCSATYLISSIEILLLLNLSLDFNPLLILEYDFLVETEKMDAGGSAGIGIAGTVCSTYLSYSENDRDLLVLILRLGTSSIDVREVAVVEIDACEPVEAVRACLDSTVTADSHRETWPFGGEISMLKAAAAFESSSSKIFSDFHSICKTSLQYSVSLNSSTLCISERGRFVGIDAIVIRYRADDRRGICH